LFILKIEVICHHSFNFIIGGFIDCFKDEREIVEQTLLKQKLVSQIYQVDRTGGGIETIKSRLVNLKEQMQASQEELKSTKNQSTNEELQSTNEELTTSKEEMQSPK
jgi:outer membrane protein TolC